MTSPSQQVSSYIITPNNHAVVMVQGNTDTLRLFKLNTRYMFNGRPFKLLAYQNAIWYDLQNQTPTLLYLDLYLDELHDKDDIANGLAYNGEYNYAIQIDADDMELTAGATGTLGATVLLNGTEAATNVVWSTSNDAVVTIDATGQYQVVGEIGESATITATVQGNTSVTASITITVVDTQSVTPSVTLNPSFSKIRQFESISFGVDVVYGATVVTPDTVQISLTQNTQLWSNQYLTITQSGSQYIITANAIAPSPQTIYVMVQNANPDFQTTQRFTLNVVSMFG